MTPQYDEVFLTLCICTHNRAESLREMMSTIAAQESCGAPFEILVIDNHSSDQTRDVVKAFSTRSPVRYLYEERLGLSHARNRALDEFRGRYLIFTDDDVRLSGNWLKSFARAICEHPEADYFGGKVLPEWRSGKPAWLGERPLALLDGLLCWFDLGDETRSFRDSDGGPIGASFAVSRRLVTRIGAFNVDLGCVGRMRGRGEESDWIARARSAGATGVYVADAVCRHRVDEKSLTLKGLFDYGVHSGRAARVLLRSAERPRSTAFASFAVRGIWQLLRGRGDRFRQCVINMGVVWGGLLAEREAPAHARRAPSSEIHIGR